MVLEHQGEHGSRWAAMESIAAKMACSAETLGDVPLAAERRGAAARL